MILRVEDTDAERSEERHLRAAARGPALAGCRVGRGAGRGRAARLLSAERTRPGLCRRHRPPARRRARRIRASARPRNSRSRAVRSWPRAGPRAMQGPARHSPADEVTKRIGQGRAYATRFRVPPGRVVEFDDVVHGAAALRDGRHRGFRRESRGRLGSLLPVERAGRQRHGHHAGAARRRSPRQHAAPGPAARGARPARAALRAPAAGPRACGHAALQARRCGRAARAARAGLPAGRAQELPRAARATPAAPTTGSRPATWRRTSTSGAAAARRRATTRRSSGTGSAKP